MQIRLTKKRQVYLSVCLPDNFKYLAKFKASSIDTDSNVVQDIVTIDQIAWHIPKGSYIVLKETK